MEDNKKFYWIKLKTDFFNQDTIDFLLSQKNGCEYIVLYQMLCLQTANNNGEMATRVGEMIIPYDVNKIVRETKYFDFDTVTIALSLFKQLGLIYEEEDKILRISNFKEMIGSETKWAEKKRLYRERQKQGLLEDNVLEENRDKSIEIELDINKEKDISKDISKKKIFTKPTIEEIENYCKERNNNVNAETFYDFYESKDWYVGKNKMKDWKACVRTWEKNKKVKEEKGDEFLETMEDFYNGTITIN